MKNKAKSRQQHVRVHTVPLLFEPRHDKTNKMAVRPAKTQISLDIRPAWSESTLTTWRSIGSLATYWAHSEDSDQTGRMPRLIWVFAGRTLILLVLSCHGSFPLSHRAVIGSWKVVRPWETKGGPRVSKAREGEGAARYFIPTTSGGSGDLPLDNFKIENVYGCVFIASWGCFGFIIAVNFVFSRK